jgi:hypothetical protein
LDELSLLLLLALKLFIVTIIKAAFLKQPQPKLQGKENPTKWVSSNFIQRTPNLSTVG